MQDEIAEQEQESPEQKKSKVLNRFNDNMSKLTALLNAPPSKTGKRKIPKDDVPELIKELYKDETEALKLEVKNDFKALLERYVTYQKAKAAKEKELDQIDQQNMKEFSEASQKLWDKIDGIPAIQQAYVQALKATNPPVQ